MWENMDQKNFEFAHFPSSVCSRHTSGRVTKHSVVKPILENLYAFDSAMKLRLPPRIIKSAKAYSSLIKLSRLTSEIYVCFASFYCAFYMNDEMLIH